MAVKKTVKKPAGIKLPIEAAPPSSPPKTSSNSKSSETKSCGDKNLPKPKNKGGRPKGQGRIRQASAKAIFLAAQGESPLEYMLRVMRQSDNDIQELARQKKIDAAELARLVAERDERRDWAAQAAAPYVHPKLAAVAVSGAPVNDNATTATAALSMLEDDELDQLERLLRKAEQRAKPIEVKAPEKLN